MSNTTSQFPGVFRGNTRLASQQDIAALKEYVETLVAGKINEVSENGYIPWKYNADGTLDLDFLFPELMAKISSIEASGISVSRDGIKLADNVKSINFEGKYVTLSIDENGSLLLNIDEPSSDAANFNQVTKFSSSKVKIDTPIVENMIIPAVDDSVNVGIFGDWEAGQKVKGKNWNGSASYDPIRLSTNGPVYTPNASSYFEVSVLDGDENVFASFISSEVKGNTRNSAYLPAANAQSSTSIHISIADFKEESTGYSFSPVFDINLALIVANGGRFKIRIVHHTGESSYSYVSDDMLYNKGAVPRLTESFIAVDNSSAPLGDESSFTWCSGIKYVKSGSLIVELSGVENLNNMAAVDDPIECSFPFAAPSSIEIVDEDYDLAMSKRASFKVKMDIADDFANFDSMSGEVALKNAIGTTVAPVTVPILINTKTGFGRSDLLNETFVDESLRTYHDFRQLGGCLCVSTGVSRWNSKGSLLEEDDGKGLMVIPGVGLQYPHGNWQEFLPAGSPNYNAVSRDGLKWFARIFTGNSSLKFGGIFKINGIRAEHFNSNEIAFLISCNRGESWYDLKTVRNTPEVVIDGENGINVVGVQTGIENAEDGILVHWSYPTAVASSQPLYFKIGMTAECPFCIKGITLLSLDGKENW